jgi:hypothetical protein
MNIQSTLTKIAEQVFTAKTCDEAKKIALDYLNESKINEEDRVKMIEEIQQKKELVKLQMYIANALLKFEGLSVNK